MTDNPEWSDQESGIRYLHPASVTPGDESCIFPFEIWVSHRVVTKSNQSQTRRAYNWMLSTLIRSHRLLLIRAHRPRFPPPSISSLRSMSSETPSPSPATTPASVEQPQSQDQGQPGETTKSAGTYLLSFFNSLSEFDALIIPLRPQLNAKLKSKKNLPSSLQRPQKRPALLRAALPRRRKNLLKKKRRKKSCHS